MTLKLGTHFLYPTLMRFEIIPIDDEWVMDGLQKKVTQSLIDDAYFYFDDFIQDWTGHNIHDWKDYEIKSWINRYENTGMETHTHSGAHASMVIYLESNPESGGEIVFYDHRPHVARGYDMKFRKTTDPTYHAPKTGDMLVFPSYLYHSVRPATHTRVSCALDLYLYNDD